MRNSQSNFEDKPDPPLNYRSMGIVGGEYCESIVIRTFNHHLRAAKRAATERNSDILDVSFILQ